MKYIRFVIIFMILALPACSSDGGSEKVPETESGSVTVSDKSDVWTYVSLDGGKVVGTCALSDTLGQKTWASRTDWDIAICNGHIKTNSGTSGIGAGGIMRTETPYDEIQNLHAGQYFIDTDTISVDD